MIKYSFFLSLLLFFTVDCFPQNFKIATLEGSPRYINLTRAIGEQQLTINSLKDTIKIDNFVAFSKKPIVLNDRFLMINYALRTGSDQSTERLLLLCVNKNKLCVAAHLESLATYDIDQVYNKRTDSLKLFDEHGYYEVKVNMIGTNNDNYKLNVDVYQKRSSKIAPEDNFDNQKKIILSFDKNQAIFFNAHIDLSQYFNVYDPRTSKITKQYFFDSVSALKLEQHIYYYIKKEWYEKGNNDYLIRLAYK